MMTQIVGGGAWYPSQVFFNSATPQYVPSGRVIDASGEKAAHIISCPKSGTLDKVEFRAAAVSQSPGSNGIKISFQTVDPADGDPDETVDQFRTITSGISSGAWVIPGLMTSDGTDSGTKRTVTKGELIAIVWEFQSFQAGADFTLGALDTIPGSTPYFDHKLGGVWGKEAFSASIALKYDDGTYPYVQGFCYPCATLTTDAINTGTTPDEIGMTFSFSSDVLIGGASVRVDLDGNADVVIYDSQYNVMATVSLDKDIRVDTTMRYYSVQFPDFRALANEIYTLAVKPTSATSVTIPSYTVNAAGMLDQIEGGGSWFMRTRTDAGAWTDLTTQRPWFCVQVTGIDQEVGGQPSTGFVGTG